MGDSIRVAVVRDGLVDNVIDAPSMDLFDDPAWVAELAGASVVRVAANQTAGPGFSYDADRSPQFQPPASDTPDAREE